MKPNQKEIKLMKSKIFANLSKNYDFKPINYEDIDIVYG